MIQFRAHFDGKNLCPDEPVSLPEGVTLEVVVSQPREAKPDAEGSSSGRENPMNIFQRIEQDCGLVEGPEDWSAEHDHYLYGSPKRADGKQ